MTASFLNGFKIYDIDQLILAVLFRFGLFWSKKLDVKFSRVFIRYENTHYISISFVFFLYELVTEYYLCYAIN